MRTQPQRRFSRPRRTMSSTISSPSGGRPGPRRARHRFHPATRELPVPAKRGLGRDEKATPAPPWKKLAERSEDRAVRGPVAHAAMELPLEHADLVAKHHQLDVLVQSCPSARSQCLKNAARDEVAETDAHGQMMVDGAEEGQLKGPIDFLAPYTSFPFRRRWRRTQDCRSSPRCRRQAPRPLPCWRWRAQLREPDGPTASGETRRNKAGTAPRRSAPGSTWPLSSPPDPEHKGSKAVWICPAGRAWGCSPAAKVGADTSRLPVLRRAR